MNKAERIERLAEWKANQETACSIHWAEHMTESLKRWSRERAEEELDFLASLGVVWLADDQVWPQEVVEPIMASRIDAFFQDSGILEARRVGWRAAQEAAQKAGWRKVEG